MYTQFTETWELCLVLTMFHGVNDDDTWWFVQQTGRSNLSSTLHTLWASGNNSVSDRKRKHGHVSVLQRRTDAYVRTHTHTHKESLMHSLH